MWRVLSFAAVAAGCHASIGNAVGDAEGSGRDSGTDARSMDGSPDAPACFNGRVVFLAFEGVTLAQATPSDAAQDHASWIGVASAAIPAYHAGVTTRLAQISSITDAIRTGLGGFPVTVVTTRPAAGPFVMVAFGGTGTTVGSQYTYATNEHDCGDLVKSDVGWVSDVTPNGKVADYAIGAIEWGLGLNGTNDPADCMCGWANSCAQSSTHCTLSASISTTASLACPNLTTQNEVGAFSQAFCQ